MGAFLTQIGQKAAERWLTLLALPGALFVAVAAAAVVLGHNHAFDLSRLGARITDWAGTRPASTIGGQVVLLAAGLAVAAVAGLAAQVLGAVIERVALSSDWMVWPRPFAGLARRLVARRERRWRRAHDEYVARREDAARARARGAQPDPSSRLAAKMSMLRIAQERPERPTWAGDRLNATVRRLDRDFHLDLGLVWPYLWLMLPEDVRAEVSAARQALAGASTLAGWAVLYLTLAVWWWPAVAVALVIAVTARVRIRTRTDTYAQLVEAAAVLHAPELARQLEEKPDARHGDVLAALLSVRPAHD